MAFLVIPNVFFPLQIMGYGHKEESFGLFNQFRKRRTLEVSVKRILGHVPHFLPTFSNVLFYWMMNQWVFDQIHIPQPMLD